ncbi:MAG: AMP-binding protein [Maritimibacter sp.]|nr:AMP-binding protein [Maritimibacter sp.]
MRDIASQIAAIAETGGETPAVIDATDRLSYAQFEAWTNDLANRINAAIGLDPKVCLVIAGFDREGIVGMFATLKTPHIFVALDRENQPANVATIADQLDAGVVVYAGNAEAVVQEVGPATARVPVGDMPDGPVAPPAPLTDLSRTTLYKRTSGSTGGAKTAAHTVEGILGDAIPGAKILELSPGAKLSVVSTFDAALTSAATLRTILSGATLLPVDLRFESPKKAVDRLIGEGLSHVYCTPTAIRLLCSGLPEGGIFPELRSILLGGEKTTMADVRLLAHSTPPDAHLRATFASTETQLVAHTTVPLTGDVQPEDFADMEVADGVRIDILDDAGAPRSVGEVGHVQVTSKMITLGYQGDADPALNAKITHNDDGTRSYMTDDMGYLTRAGRIVLTSRAGREIKIRGRRVDLGALEGWLTAQEDIFEAAVVVQPIGHDGGPRLAAFIKGEDGFEGTSALRKRMQAQLIAAMQPTAIVQLDELPRTPNQKINRRALESDLSHLEADGGETLQDDGLLGQVAQIWASVLNRAVTGAEKDFFDLGGDSIAATITAVRMEEKLGLPVDTGFVYRYPVLAEQVAALEAMEGGADALPDRLLVPLTIPGADGPEPEEKPQRVFLISGAGGHVFPFAPVAQELQRQWDILGILHPGILDSEPELGSISDYADRMGRAIRASQPKGPYFIVGYSFGGAVAHEIGRRLKGEGETVGVVLVDLQLLTLGTLRYKAWYAREKIENKLRRGRNGGPQRGFLDDPDLDPVEKAKLSISIRSMNLILERYRPEKSNAPTVLITAEQKDEPYGVEDLGWSKVAPLLSVSETPGNHLEMFKDAYMEGFARVLDESLTLLAQNMGVAGR